MHVQYWVIDPSIVASADSRPFQTFCSWWWLFALSKFSLEHSLIWQDHLILLRRQSPTVKPTMVSIQAPAVTCKTHLYKPPDQGCGCAGTVAAQLFKCCNDFHSSPVTITYNPDTILTYVELTARRFSSAPSFPFAHAAPILQAALCGWPLVLLFLKHLPLWVAVWRDNGFRPIECVDYSNSRDVLKLLNKAVEYVLNQSAEHSATSQADIFGWISNSGIH
jgi:hypothetical protein